MTDFFGALRDIELGAIIAAGVAIGGFFLVLGLALSHNKR